MIEIVHHFQDPDGEMPFGTLIQGSDGALYGTAYRGGAGDSPCGTIYRVNPDGSGFGVLRHLEGTGEDGAYPVAGVIQGTDGALYGVTTAGGATDHGVIYKINPDGSDFQILRCLVGYEDGADPSAALLQGKDGALYGTAAGGAYLHGVVFKVKPDGSGYQVLHRFMGYPEDEPEDEDDDGSNPEDDNPFDGSNPYAPLIQGSDGALYGTTKWGGNRMGGTIFKINPDGSGYRVLHMFSLQDGDYPCAGLLQGKDGALYGTTSCGGGRGHGVIFKINPDGSNYQVLHRFAREDGAFPQSALIEGPDGALYGTATHGGANDRGCIFKINPDGSKFRVVYSFAGFNGAYPEAGIIFGTDGALYGTAREGGANGHGVVFRLKLS